MALKSGTQKFHGALWEFNRNDAYNAAYYFFKQQDVPTPELRLNIFGGNVGGPIIKNKTFFFVTKSGASWSRAPIRALRIQSRPSFSPPQEAI